MKVFRIPNDKGALLVATLTGAHGTNAPIGCVSLVDRETYVYACNLVTGGPEARTLAALVQAAKLYARSKNLGEIQFDVMPDQPSLLKLAQRGNVKVLRIRCSMAVNRRRVIDGELPQ